MKIQFDATQSYQLDAIASVINLFDGQPLAKSDYTPVLHSFNMQLFGALVQTELGVGNNFLLDKQQILANLKNIQEKNLLDVADKVEAWDWTDEDVTHWCPHFSIEMETGTGKTYVYLRTILEMNRKYGFRKFIIVVPSVAIREGVLKNLEITRDHFRALFNNMEAEHYVYDGKRISQLRQFATSNNLQILVINIDAFRKNFTGTEAAQKSNVIYKENDKLSGRQPIQYIRATHPIVIIDEPQSVDSTERSMQAIQALNPLCTLRYSATHKNPYNLIYKLDPIKSYELRLVKQIVVASVTSDTSHNDAFVKLSNLDNKNGIKAQLEIDCVQSTGIKRKKVTVKHGDDLFIKSGERAQYTTGYQVAEINAEPGNEFVLLTNGHRLKLGQEIGGMQDDLWREQIHRTVLRHLEKELQLLDRGIKVLSLFFIDRVANYRSYATDGKVIPGKFATAFEDAYRQLLSQERFKMLAKHPVEDVHNGYFAEDKKGFIKDTSGDTQADDDVYNKIMRNKEQLLSLEEPLRFIFSHSALREGWDNPNVFQICTLREMGTDRERRQTLGRGLRLPVDQRGERIFDDNINRLVVVANENYEEFARELQSDYERDCGVTFGKVPQVAFAQLEKLENGQPAKMGKAGSQSVWTALAASGYIDSQGRIQPKFQPSAKDFDLTLPEEFSDIKKDIIDVLSSYQLERHIKRDEAGKPLSFKKAVSLDPEFQNLWNRIKAKTAYAVEYDTNTLVQNSTKAIRKMERIEPARLHYTEVGIGLEHRGVSTTLLREGGTLLEYSGAIPDALAYLQAETELTRATLVRILTESKRLNDLLVNPQRFMDAVATIVKHELNRLIIDGIKYEQIAGEEFEMRLFETKELIGYLHNRLEVRHSVYDAILYDSETERKFAEQLDNREDIKLFLKLPSWFLIDTPVGNYNPDWAIVKHDSSILYLVRETKGTKDFEKLRNIEADKVHCGKRHFDSLGVDYAVVTNASEI